jgi:hypothetical protein
MTATQIRNRIAELTQIIRETNCINKMQNAQLSINGLQAKLREMGE